MNSKKSYIIIMFLIIAIIIVYSYIGKAVIKEKNDNNLSNKELRDYKEYDNIIKSNDSVICKVNNEEITDKDISITQYLEQEKDSQKAKKIAIRDKVILQEIKKDNLKLEDKEKNYLDNLIVDLNTELETKSKYSEEERSELLKCLYENLYNNALIDQFTSEFIKKLTNKTFTTEDKDILKKYTEYLEIKNKWDNQQGVSYGKLWEAKESVYEAYVQSLVDNSTIEYYK